MFELGLGSLSVQGMTVNGHQPCLNHIRSLRLARESCGTHTVRKTLEAANAVPVKNVFEKIDFVITDQTVDKLGVENIVAE